MREHGEQAGAADNIAEQCRQQEPEETCLNGDIAIQDQQERFVGPRHNMGKSAESDNVGDDNNHPEPRIFGAWHDPDDGGDQKTGRNAVEQRLGRAVFHEVMQNT